MDTPDPTTEKPPFDPARLHYSTWWGYVSKWRFRFTLGSFILWISLISLLLGNIVTGALLLQSKQELQRAAYETGYLVYDDPSQIHVSHVPTPGHGVWQFRAHLPEGRRYRLLHQVDGIPEYGYPEIKHDSVWREPFDGGDFVITFALNQETNGEWRLNRTVHYSRQSGGGSGSGMELLLTQCDWIRARTYGFSTSPIHEIKGDSQADIPRRYFVIERQSDFATFGPRQLTFAPDQTIDLLRLRVAEVDGPQPNPQSRYDNAYRSLADSANFGDAADGIMVWIEPVTQGTTNAANATNP